MCSRHTNTFRSRCWQHTVSAKIFILIMSFKNMLEKAGGYPVLSMGAYGALLWQLALNMSLGMLHYLQLAFLWPRWDMTGATGSLWIKQKDLKAQEGGCRMMGRPEDIVEYGGCRLRRTCSCSPKAKRELRQAGRNRGTDKRVEEKDFFMWKSRDKSGWRD